MSAKQVAIVAGVGLFMLVLGLSVGNLQETGQTLLIAGAIVLVVYGAAAAVFIAGLYGTFKLWQIVLDALRGAKSHEAKALLQVIGGFNVAGSLKQDKTTKTIRVAGTGLLGTLAIMGFASFVIYVMFSIVPKDADIVKIGKPSSTQQ